MNHKVLIIAGPTASGKKEFALRAAERFNGEIVSADSRKVYRYLDIGTAKPSREERERIPHHLIGIIEPDEPFSAGEWVRRASGAVSGILERGKLPIISGGTGFYIEAFMQGLSEGISVDAELRNELARELAEYGGDALYNKLEQVDPVRAAELHVHDTFRVLRSLEIFYSTGQVYSELRKNAKITGGEYDYFSVGIALGRPVLYRRINERVDRMVKAGLLDELSAILARGYARGLPSLDTVGYKEWFPYLDGADSFENC
ncbi:MAG: tRNA (adenosine(37)-N6)-dimethylallyltransferase MiaA, partial [Candidatus Latescibacter sp.]|nr:tRNA (adenosine(37)-N6)-dimethylallyltransferase MiaA [Candidatus Latescibacter sp.]